MSLDAIRSIASAEEEVRQLKSDAQQKSKLSIAEAESAGKAVVSESVSAAEAKASELYAQAEAKALQFAQELQDNTYNKCAAIRAKAETHLDSAASLIIRRVVES